MKKLLMSLALLCLPFFALAEDFTQDEQNWIAAVQPFYKEAKASGITSLVGVVKDADPGTSPVHMMFRKDSKECVFVVSVRDNFASRVVQSLPGAGSGGEIARAAATAHEFGHCLHNLALANKLPGYESLPPVNSAESEAMADVFAMAWFAKNRPDDFSRIQRLFREMRKLPGQDDKHDTRNHLFAARDLPEQLAAKPASPFDYAKKVVMGIPLPQETAPVTTALASPN